MSDQTPKPIKPVILRPSEIVPRERGGGARTIPLVVRGIGATSFINGITTFEPGAAIPFHCHNCEESVMLLDGDAVAEIDGIDYPLQPGDMSFIPAGVRHRFRNLSTTDSMRILWIYGSPDANRTNLETGATGLIDDEHRVPAI
jgi:quercetin dioxygenase-like cupin family protein